MFPCIATVLLYLSTDTFKSEEKEQAWTTPESTDSLVSQFPLRIGRLGAIIPTYESTRFQSQRGHDTSNSAHHYAEHGPSEQLAVNPGEDSRREGPYHLLHRGGQWADRLSLI